MKTVWYMLLVGCGLILSLPITIIIIAIQQAKTDVEKIQKHLGE